MIASSDDYLILPPNGTFSIGSSEICFGVINVNDTAIEENETIVIENNLLLEVLETESEGAEGAATLPIIAVLNVTVTLFDNDGKDCL